MSEAQPKTLVEIEDELNTGCSLVVAAIQTIDRHADLEPTRAVLNCALEKLRALSDSVEVMLGQEAGNAQT